MKAFRIETGCTIAPFGGSVGQVIVAGKTLAEVQCEALVAAGFELVDDPPQDGPYLLFSDRTWFTPSLLKLIRVAGPGRLRVTDARWTDWTSALNTWTDVGVYELAICQGEPTFDGLDELPLEIDFRAMEIQVAHPSFEHANQFPVVSESMVLQIEHWSHVILVNQLVLAARMEEARSDWVQASFLGKLWRALKVLFRARSINGWKVAASMTERAANASVHPTAVVEFSVLHENCEVGPHAVVRGSVVGKGAVVDSHAVVNASVLGEASRVGRFGHINLCTLFPKAMVSSGDGFQMCVFGRESFVAWGATILDLSFGSSIKVEARGPGSEWVDSKVHFLGAAIGDRARIGHGVKVGYGVCVPPDALLVDDGDLLKQWGDGPVDEPSVVRDGQAVPKKDSRPQG